MLQGNMYMRTMFCVLQYKGYTCHGWDVGLYYLSPEFHEKKEVAPN